MKEEIKINGITYPLRWTLLSQQLIEDIDLKTLGNIARVAIIATAAIRGANWQSTMTADRLLSEIGADMKKLNELDQKCAKVMNDFIAFNSKPEDEGNA